MNRISDGGLEAKSLMSLFGRVGAALSSHNNVGKFDDILRPEDSALLSRWKGVAAHGARQANAVHSKVCSVTGVDRKVAKGNDSRPSIELWLEVEPLCNLSCAFCYNYWRGETQKTPRPLPFEKFVEGIKRILSRVDCEKLSISGGEPLLRLDLDALLAGLKPLSIPTVLTTNGSYLTSERLDALRTLGVNSFQIPLHSADLSTHDTLTGAPSWEAAVSAIVNAVTVKANVAVVFVATSRNLSHFVPTLHLCAALGVHTIIFNRFVPSGLGRANKNNLGVPTDQELVEALRAADVVARRYGQVIELGVPIEIDGGDRHTLKAVQLTSCPVSRGQHRWTVGADGRIRRCNQSESAVGDLLGDLDGFFREVERGDEDREPDAGDVTAIRPCGILRAQSLVQINTVNRDALYAP